jgi:hypothetical protein
MKLPKLNAGDVLLVKWWDTLDSVTWRPQDTVRDWGLSLIASVGIFLRTDDKKFKMAHSVTEDGEADGIVIHIDTIESIKILKKRKI